MAVLKPKAEDGMSGEHSNKPDVLSLNELLLTSNDNIAGSNYAQTQPPVHHQDSLVSDVQTTTNPTVGAANTSPRNGSADSHSQVHSTTTQSFEGAQQSQNAEPADEKGGSTSQKSSVAKENDSGNQRDHQDNSNQEKASKSDAEHDSQKEDEEEDSTNPVHRLKNKVTDRKQKYNDKAHPPGGFDDTPLPEYPPGYTLKFTFHKAWNLPIADIHNGVADPFIHATIKAPVPSRHKEDPPLTRRTRTIRATTDPVWEEEWIVANIPAAGFSLKCRFYDEDYPDHDDRLGNLTYETSGIDENWKGIPREHFELKKRVGSKRAYFFKAITTPLRKNRSITPGFELSIEVLGKSEGCGSQVYTIGPTRYIQHFSPMIGRMAGIKVREDGKDDEGVSLSDDDKKSKKYDFQATEIQLEGPVPSKLYHRYVEFRPMIGRMFDSAGLRGKLLHKALTKQHNRIYNYDSTTKYGSFKACSEEASLAFLKLAHFDEGGRIFTYVLTLDGLWRFTETGKEFGIDMLSKHTMHSNVATYIACSGEFFIRRLEEPTGTSDQDPDQPTHPDDQIPDGPPHDSPPSNPSYYQLVIDNDSGTYRPDKSVLPDLKRFLEHNLPGLGIVTMACDDDELSELKKKQNQAKNKEGKRLNMVLNRSPSSSSFSSSDESRLGDLEESGDAMSGTRKKSKKERAWDALEDPQSLKQTIKESNPLRG